MKIIVVIPARFKSSRFPGKPLAKILNKPMIQWVAELSEKAVGTENVFIATDSMEICNVVEAMGYQAVITSEHCLTGTDRIAEVAEKINADIYINVQGDEPLVDPVDIQKVIDAKIQNPNEVINGYTAIGDNESVDSVNIPKVIFTEDERLVYMSRMALPGFKETALAPKQFFKQVCIYAFNREELLAFGSYGRKSTLESYEDIEIIRFFELQKTIRLQKTSSGNIAVDVPDDIEKVESILSARRNQ